MQKYLAAKGGGKFVLVDPETGEEEEFDPTETQHKTTSVLDRMLMLVSAVGAGIAAFYLTTLWPTGFLNLPFGAMTLGKLFLAFVSTVGAFVAGVFCIGLLLGSVHDLLS